MDYKINQPMEKVILNDFNLVEDQIPQGFNLEISKSRRSAYRLFRNMPIPNKHMHAWRKADLEGWNPGTYKLASIPNKYIPCKPKNLNRPFSWNNLSGILKISKEGYSGYLDEDLKQEGVILCDLHTAERDHPHLLKRIIGKIVPAEENKLTAMTHAFAQSGVFLYVPKGIHISKPIYSYLTGSGSDQLYIEHNLIFLDEDSSSTFIQGWISENEHDNESMFSGVTEIQINEKAELNLIEIESWDNSWRHFNHERANIGKYGKINWTVFVDGSRYSKNDIGINLMNSNASALITGIHLPVGDHQIDFDTHQNHLAARTKSDLLFKGALANQGRSVWTGMIKVTPDAIQSDGYQINRNLMLCGQPHVDSVPGLEIMTDDIQCSHGVTISDIDHDQIFYLKSRGIAEVEAKQIIAEGFLNSALERIPYSEAVDVICKRIHSCLMDVLCE